PWVGAMLKVQPDAWDIWFDQSLGRYGGELDHDKPWYFYLVRAPLLWMPWLVPILVGLRQALRRATVAPTLRTFLLCWAIGGLALLSFSAGKRLFYALPCVPPVMVLAGIGLNHIVRGLPPRLSGLARWVYWAHWLVVPGALAGAWFAAARYDDYRTPILATGTMGAVGLAAVLALYGMRRREASIVTFAAVVLTLFTYATATIITPMEVQGNYYARLGRALAGREVILFEDVGAEIVFYSGRPLPFVPHRDLVMDWLRDHPRAYVITERGYGVEELARIGVWREVPLVPISSSLMHRDEDPFVVLELTSPIQTPVVPQATDEPLPAPAKPAED
ncbi:MAG: hypothetical protein JXL80_13595, partial [Planctomycetes bacterium]|nr:hypothetical protein [Planctomycetota bacterium]